MPRADSYIARIRGVELLPGERVGALYTPDSGLVAEPTRAGQLLVATDQRFINIVDSGVVRVREVFDVSTISGVSVRSESKRGLSWRQWGTLIAGGIFIYVALAYWLVDRLPNIIVPVINIHAFALVIMLLVALAGWLFWRGFTQRGGAVLRVHGAGWTVEADCQAPYADGVEFARLALAMQREGLEALRAPPGTDALATSGIPAGLETSAEGQ